MVDFRLKPLDQVQAEATRRNAQRSSFYRNQAIGLLIAAGAVLLYRLLHTPSGWLFPQGWWRLW